MSDLQGQALEWLRRQALFIPGTARVDDFQASLMADFAAEVVARVYEECTKLTCVYCASEAPLEGNSHRLESPVSESGYWYVDCSAVALRERGVLHHQGESKK